MAKSASFNPQVLQQLADELYRGARFLTFKWGVVGLIVFGVAGIAFGPIGALVGAMLGVVVGGMIAAPIADRMRVQAQEILLQLQIEANTRRSADLLERMAGGKV